MPVDRARLRARVHDRQRTRKFGTLSVKVLTGVRVPYSVAGTYSDGWNLEHVEDATKGADYHKIFIMDLDGSRGENLKKATAFSISGHIYTRNAGDAPEPAGVIPEWVYRVQRTGVRQIDL